MLAEYWSDNGIGATNAVKITENHGKFLGYVTSDGKQVNANSHRIGKPAAIPQRKQITVDMEAVARMRAEQDARIARMENGGSYWS